jgi:nucleoid-associated protein YgaU
MGLTDLFKLDKLKILAFEDSKRKSEVSDSPFEAMFNPESFKQNYAIIYGKNQSLNSSENEKKYMRSEPSELSLELILDGTGVSEMGITQLFGSKTVSERVEEFLTLTFRMNGKIHEPNYLRVEWGDLKFECRLGSVEIDYTSFDRDGTPLRAKLTVSLIADMEVEKRMAVEDKKSSDLTHRRVVRQGDTLTLLTKEIYGTSAPYWRVAQANRLDNFRLLTPGQELAFPPLRADEILPKPDKTPR